MTWNVKVLTLFPEMFPGYLQYSLAGKALQNKIWSYEAINIRNYSKLPHNNVDSAPIGGGHGMIMRPDIVASCIDFNVKKDVPIFYMSPRGEKITQDKILELTKYNEIAILCGRFEGVDERVIKKYNMQELSIGDYILSGGEVATLTVMDACIRLLPGVLKNKHTVCEESFSNELLEYPLYTKPNNWEGIDVPEVLLSGHHEKITEWRLEQSEKITKERRPDLWIKYQEGAE